MKKKAINLFFVLIFAVTINSNGQNKYEFSSYSLNPVVGIKLSPRPELGLVGIGAVAGLLWDNPAKRIFG